MPASTLAARIASAPILSLGFRPFFCLATGYAVIVSLLWYAAYAHAWLPAGAGYAPALWHAHEMVFGYAAAVVSGFLLTAVHNWTSRPTLHGLPLAGLALLWLLARVLPLAGDSLLWWWLASVDCGFMLLLCVAVSAPLVQARLWPQLAVVSKLVGLFASNVLFYFGLLSDDAYTARLGVLCGLYLLLSLVLMFARRVVPGFIERGVDQPVRLRNSKAVDAAALFLFLAFAVVELFTRHVGVAAALAGALCAVHGWRLAGWHTHQLWRKPLLWVLYLAYGFIVCGFALKALQPWNGYAASFGLHAFAYGGIGLMTAGMLSRVSLGHTGRDLRHPPPALKLVYAALVVGAVLRVLAPQLAPPLYVNLVAAAALVWAGAFTLLFITLLPVWSRPRLTPSVT